MVYLQKSGRIKKCFLFVFYGFGFVDVVDKEEVKSFRWPRMATTVRVRE